MKKNEIFKVVAIIVACLFAYAALSKLADYDKSRHEMMNQVFSIEIAKIFTWLIPALELSLAALLIIPKTRKTAVWGSFTILVLFTIYIAVVMTGVFGRVPCSCGGILKNMSYGTHLIFNLFFVILALSALAIENNWVRSDRIFTFKKRKDPLQSSV